MVEDAGESFDELAPIPMRPVTPEEAGKILQAPPARLPEDPMRKWARLGFRVVHEHRHTVDGAPAIVVLILSKG